MNVSIRNLKHINNPPIMYLPFHQSTGLIYPQYGAVNQNVIW